MGCSAPRPGCPDAVPRFGTVLLDLDGTVIDTVDLIRESHRHAVGTVLGVDLPDEVLTAHVGRPLIDQMREFSPERADEMLHVFREWNHANTGRLIAEYEGMDAVLTRLRGAGCRLAIVTSKSHPTVALAFDAIPGLEATFEAVIAMEDSTHHKPHPEPLLVALARMDADPADTCYVGDAPFDIRAAHAAGLSAIGVTWGFFTPQALLAEGPDHVVDTPAALADLLTGA